jgi:zinc D-Ala-D-Ala carboxypeptidase
MIKISKHITYGEATRSQTAIRRGIDNTPDQATLERMRLVAEKVFEPVREHYDIPIGIGSFYRSEKLNRVIGGSKKSQHCKGEAIDIDAQIYGGVTNKEIFEWIKKNLIWDQLIAEGWDGIDYEWVHVSFSEFRNRKQVLVATFKDGKTIYSY